MAIARLTQRHPLKRERIAQHIEALKQRITSRFPDAKFQIGKIPESSWPALFVACKAKYVSDVTDPLQDLDEEFFLKENMDVHVIVVGEGEFD